VSSSSCGPRLPQSWPRRRTNAISRVVAPTSFFAASLSLIVSRLIIAPSDAEGIARCGAHVADRGCNLYRGGRRLPSRTRGFGSLHPLNRISNLSGGLRKSSSSPCDISCLAFLPSPTLFGLRVEQRELHRLLADPEISRFSHKERPVHARLSDHAEFDGHSHRACRFAFRRVNNVVLGFITVSRLNSRPRRSQRRFADVLTGACARIRGDADCYSSIAVDFHHILLAGFSPAHSPEVGIESGRQCVAAFLP
jgi:hypothetical protein